MENEKIIELLLVAALLPLVVAMFNNLKARVDGLEKNKVDKEAFDRLEHTLSEHRNETRDGFSKISGTLTEILVSIGGTKNGGR